MRALLIALSLLQLTTGADAQMVPSQSAPVQAASVPATAESTLAFARAPRAEGAIVITIVRGDGPDLTQALAPNAPGWQGPLPADWVRITCLGERAVCLSIDRGATDEALVRLTAYPRATLTATWPATVAGQAVRVMVSRQTEAGDSAFGPTRGQWSVPTRADGRFSLDVPQGTLDIRLVASGCAAVYRFDVKAGATTALGPLPCVPGGSIAARVRDSQSGDTVPSCVATVRPSGRLQDSPEATRFSEVITRTATCDAFGNVHVPGLAPGHYRVTTHSTNHADHSVDVEVTEERQTYVDVALGAFRSLTVQISPQVAPDGRPWTVEISPFNILDDVMRDLMRATTNPRGEVRFPRVSPEEYQIDVFTQDELHVAVESTMLPDPDTRVELAVPLTRVVGRVSLRDQPVAGARVGVENWHSQGLFVTDDEGRYAGWIAKPSPEKDQLSMTVRAAGTGRFSRRFVTPRSIDEQTLEVNLDLGDSRVIARVVDAGGHPVPDVEITVAGRDRPSPSFNPPTETAMTNATGTAIFEGLAEGRYIAYGSLPTRSIQSRELDVVTDTDVSVELVLVSTRTHQFEFVSALGEPIAGAAVAVRSDAVKIAEWQRYTDGLGQVELSIAETSTRSALTVWAESQALWSGCIGVGSGDRTRIELPSPTAAGTLRLTVPRQMLSAGLHLVGDRGAVFPLFDLLRWRRTSIEDGESTSTWIVPGLAAGRYRAILYPGRDITPVVQAACAGAISFDDPSAGTLTPGGVLELKWPTPK